jgi:hypothetical protein
MTKLDLESDVHVALRLEYTKEDAGVIGDVVEVASRST